LTWTPEKIHRTLAATLIPAAALLAASIPARAQGPTPEEFAQQITLNSLRTHLHALMDIARANDGNRASGKPGYKESAGYIKQKLKQAGYDVAVQPFDYFVYTENAPSIFNRLSPDPKEYEDSVDILSMTYSGAGDVTARVVPARGIVIPATPDPSSASGCAPKDFPKAVQGNIALIQRGACDFVVKAQNAIAAGAVGVVIFNEGNANFPDRIPLFGGTLGTPVTVPVLSASYAVGVELYELAQSGEVTARLKVDATTTPGKTTNIIGTSRTGDPSQAIIVGSHLDSVQAGPGINDNGTGSAANLAIAETMAKLGIEPTNQVRFAFWGAEEDGLFGSTFYVNSLTQGQLNRIALNLNFDMLGSPNYIRMVYDGDGDVGPAGPPGSGEIESVFKGYFKRQGLATAPTAFDGRSDYGPFIEAGVPAGGLFSGAEVAKTKPQARVYGGEAGVPYDECYHQKCDSMRNVNDEGLLQLARGAAYATLEFAMRESPFGADVAADKVAKKLDLKYSGSRLKR
jgi:Zn-dependent M28 family amino/carboxypeptidase